MSDKKCCGEINGLWVVALYYRKFIDLMCRCRLSIGTISKYKSGIKLAPRFFANITTS